VTSRHTALEMLCEGTVHIAITSAREFCKDVEYRHFLTDQVVLIVPPEHPWAEHGWIEPQDLLTENFILREEPAGTRRVLEDGLAEHGLSINQLRTVMTLGNSEAIRMAVQERIGVAFVSHLAAINCLRMEQVVMVNVAGLDLRQELYIGRNVRRPATQAQAAFWEFVHTPANRALLRLGE